MRFRLSAVALMLTTGLVLVSACSGASIGGSGAAPAGAVASVLSTAPASPSAPITASPAATSSATIAPAPAGPSTAAAATSSTSGAESASAVERSGSDSAEGGGGPLCDLFTTAEVQEILGAEVQAPHDAAGGTGCQWDGSGGVDATYLQIQVIDDPSYYVEQSFADGFETVKGIGTAAFVVPELGGWAAQAMTDDATFAVAVNGGTASKQSATGLLTQLVDRY